MQRWKSLSRFFLLLALLISLLAGISAPAFVNGNVSAAPKSASASHIVISEFRTSGPGDAANEFIELYNPLNTTINISGWEIWKSSGCGTTLTRLATIGTVSIVSGQHFLIGKSPEYTGPVDQSYTSSPSVTLSDDGGIALIDTSDVIVDQVGMCNTTTYVEFNPASPAYLTPLSGNINQSYERKDNGCTDTNNNAADFVWNQTSSNPQTLSSNPVRCLGVINVTSPTATTDPYTIHTGDTIAITVQFSSNVDVTGFPTLLLETGATHRNATYVSGSGSDTLTFSYTVQINDVSGDLDYVDINSLSLNGGTITGAVGNADLTLPSSGSPGSLGANKNIVIDNQLPPTVTINQAIGQSDPTGLFPINFTVVFSETINVSSFTTADITQTGTATGITWGITDLGDHTTFTLFANPVVGPGTLIPSIAANTVQDSLGNLNTTASTRTDNTVTFENTRPTVTVAKAQSQVDPALGPPVDFTVVFSKSINVSSFTVGDITQNGTIAASLITWSITEDLLSDHKKFTLSAIAVAGNGSLTPTIADNKVTDLAGNGNIANVAPYDSVTYNDNVSPTVTINKAVGQPDPTAVFPIKFAVVFSEPIIASIFTPSDITQTGTATGITWSIADSGDHKNFTLSATAVSGTGTLTPSIAANRVTDLVGNNNIGSTTPSGGDGTVIYENISPSVTINQASGQTDPTSALPVNFTVTFSEPIDSNTFTKADITQLGTATGVNWSLGNSVDGRVFPLSATNMNTKGTLKPYLPANLVKDVAGNNNFASTSTDNIVTYTGKISTPAPTNSPTPTTTPTLNLIINEVAWMGTRASTADEWIELYNPGGTVDLTGWKLSITNSSSGNNVTINLIGSIPSGGYFVLASNSTVFRELTPQMTFSNSLSNDGEVMKLLNPSNVIVDTSNHDGGGWPAGASSTFSSMERVGRSNETPGTWATFASTLVVAHDKNNIDIKGTPGQANWTTLVTLTPSPTRTPTSRITPIRTPTPAIRLSGRPIINEFLARPGFDWNQDGKVDVFDEFIEIKNVGAIDISLAGWRLDDEFNLGSAAFTLPAITLKPSERFIFYGLETNILLSDGGDTVRLLNPTGQVLDSFTYPVAKVEDQSTCRLPDITSNDFGFGQWFTDCTPTPNFANTRDGTIPSMPGGEPFEPFFCALPDTLPADFLFAECRGYGSDIWNTYYWDQPGWQGEQYVPENMTKWESFVK